MLNQGNDETLGRVFHALTDPSRRVIVERLVAGPASVKQVAEPLPMSLPAVLQHLQVLESAGVVVTEKVGRVRGCRIQTDGLREAEDWLTRQRSETERQLDRLEQFLQDGD